MQTYASYEEILSKTDWVRRAPTQSSTVDHLCLRPISGERAFPPSLEFSTEVGVVGDRWLNDCYLQLEDGASDPRVQVCLLPLRVFKTVCERPNAIHPGDTIITDLWMGEDTLPPGTRLNVGEAIIEVSDVPNKGCPKWRARFGVDSLRWINQPEHRGWNLRGVLAQIIQGGVVRPGDSVTLI